MSPTKYYLSNSPAQITVVRRHHPLQGRMLEVQSAGKAMLVVRLADGSAMKLPRCWTDADGARHCGELQGDSEFCLIGLRELLKLVDVLGRRAVPLPDGCGEIDAAHDNEGDSDAETAVARVYRAGKHRGALGELSRAGANPSHAAICAVDGAAACRAGAAGEEHEGGRR